VLFGSNDLGRYSFTVISGVVVYCLVGPIPAYKTLSQCYPSPTGVTRSFGNTRAIRPCSVNPVNHGLDEIGKY
jgi:hypothetical protein